MIPGKVQDVSGGSFGSRRFRMWEAKRPGEEIRGGLSYEPSR